MQELLWVLQREKHRREYRQEYVWMQKKTYDQYVELFQKNNPGIMKSISEYRKENEESSNQEEIDSNYILEIDKMILSTTASTTTDNDRHWDHQEH